ncbi:hypothetical protein ILYODFUR_011096 [Ilyodon furcidens]|uniref:Uncharacterized protein n=1 Tax=Ilyodon furcidens TaxID=33524 RepID=A0ABV0TTN7_9TELE
MADTRLRLSSGPTQSKRRLHIMSMHRGRRNNSTSSVPALFLSDRRSNSVVMLVNENGSTFSLNTPDVTVDGPAPSFSVKLQNNSNFLFHSGLSWSGQVNPCTQCSIRNT